MHTHNCKGARKEQKTLQFPKSYKPS